MIAVFQETLYKLGRLFPGEDLAKSLQQYIADKERQGFRFKQTLWVTHEMNPLMLFIFEVEYATEGR